MSSLYQLSVNWDNWMLDDQKILVVGKKWAGAFYVQKGQGEWPDCEVACICVF